MEHAFNTYNIKTINETYRTKLCTYKCTSVHNVQYTNKEVKHC